MDNMATSSATHQKNEAISLRFQSFSKESSPPSSLAAPLRRKEPSKNSSKLIWASILRRERLKKGLR